VRNLATVVLLLCVEALPVHAQRAGDLTTPTPLPEGAALVIGFLGGWERWDDAHRGVRKLALALREKQIAGLHVETFANRNRHLAVDLVRKALDWDSNGSLDAHERSAHKIIVYGQSFGGAAAIKFARELDTLEIRVALTVQVDSVGVGDNIIPPNVFKAANFYQSHRFTVRGERHITAADPRRTTIVENTRFEYSDRDPAHRPETWLRRRFGGAHARMDADPAVWTRVEALILDCISGSAR
jgi:pimeloyl-ACP methyl ester carboxylesterase